LWNADGFAPTDFAFRTWPVRTWPGGSKSLLYRRRSS